MQCDQVDLKSLASVTISYNDTLVECWKFRQAQKGTSETLGLQKHTSRAVTSPFKSQLQSESEGHESDRSIDPLKCSGVTVVVRNASVTIRYISEHQKR